MTEAALRHAGVSFEWVSTARIVDPAKALQGYAGVLIAPGSPYKDFAGALNAIRYAREQGVPLVGT